jgi:putative phosphonate transport system ATP-binding protein
MTPLLSVQGVTKFYGRNIGCKDVSFDLYPGEVMGIVGESGSGKSTLLSCMAGHIAPDMGRVVFDTRMLIKILKILTISIKLFIKTPYF